MQCLHAVPFRMMPLDAQIRKHGGRGFTTDVKVKAIAGTYSFRYEFDTADGPKTMVSANQFLVGVLHADPSGPFYIIHDADKGEYRMVTSLCRDTKTPVLEYLLGYSFDKVVSVLRSWYPNYTNWKLTKPIINE